MWSRREWGRCCVAGLWMAGPLSTLAQPAAVPAGATPTAQAAPAGAASAPPPGERVLQIAVDNKSAFCHLPLLLAESMGYFPAEGLNVQVREYPDASQATQALLSGAAQVLAGGYSQNITLQARGHWLQSIVLQGRAPQIVLGVSHRWMPQWKGLQDLRGKRIGVVALGSASHRVARLALARARLGPNDVQFVPLPTAARALSAFRGGQIEAISYPDPLITELEQGGDLRVLVDTRTVRGNADLFGGPLPAACLSAPTAWVAQNRASCQALAHALVHALKWLQTAGPSDLIKAVPEPHFQGDRARYLAAFSRAREAWAPDGMMPASGPATALRSMAQLGDPPALSEVDLALTFTNEFAARAKARYRA